MRHVVVVAPFLGASMSHALRCFAALENTRLGVISHEPLQRVPEDIRGRLSGHMQIEDALDPQQLVDATRAFIKEWGRVDGLEGYLEQLQVPIAAARDVLDLDGLSRKLEGLGDGLLIKNIPFGDHLIPSVV